MIANPWATDTPKKKKNPKPKPKPNLKTDGSKANPRMAAKIEIRNRETELITSASASNSSNIDHRQSDWRLVVASASPIGSEIGIAQIGSEIPSSPSPYRLDVLPSPTAPPFGLSLPTPSTLSLLYTFLLSDSLFFSNGFLSTLTSLYLFLSSEE